MNQEKREQMLREGKPLLQKLEECIKQFGDEFQKQADDYFWQESDIVPILLGHLWKQEIFMHNFKHRLGDGKVPLVHAEKMIGERRRVDLYLLDPDTAVESIREHAYPAPADDSFRNMNLLAAIEVEGTDVTKLQGACTDAVDKLLNSSEPIAQSYLVVFAQITLLKKGQPPPKDYTDKYEELLEFLKKKHKNEWNSLNLKTYCVPAYCVPFRPLHKMEPVWIP